MPPKLPNLKFKPKTDTRVKEEVDDDDPELMSLVQRERLKQVQAQAAKEQASLTKAVSAGPVSEPSGDVKTEANTSTVVGRSSKSVTAANSSTPVSAAQKARVGLGSTVMRVGAGFQSAAVPTYDPTAELPRDTLARVMYSVSGTGDDGSMKPDDMDDSMGASSFIRPVPLSQDSLSGGPSSTAGSLLATSAKAHRNDNEEDDAAEGENTAGVAFLNAWRDECNAAYEACARYFGLNRSTGAVSGPPQDSLMWLQLPRQMTAEGSSSGGSSSWKQLPPGKVGSLQIHRSGRCVLLINGVSYEMACDENEKVSQTAVAVLPSDSGPSSHSSCFELGKLSKKFVCTPIL